MKNDSYIHLKVFEAFVRYRFQHIIDGKGLVVPRVAVKIALDDIFSDIEGVKEHINRDERKSK